MASPTRWTWVWVNSGRRRWTGRPGVLRFMGSQGVGHDWATELNWTETKRLKWHNRHETSVSIFCFYFLWLCSQTATLLHGHKVATSISSYILSGPYPTTEIFVLVFQEKPKYITLILIGTYWDYFVAREISIRHQWQVRYSTWEIKVEWRASIIPQMEIHLWLLEEEWMNDGEHQ